VGVVEIPDFVKGKKTRRGRPTDVTPQPVTVVTTDCVDEFLGARDQRERTEHLRDLRDRGKLIHNKGTLRQRVRGELGPWAYVFKGPAAKVPKIGKGRLPVGVLTWG
jgi:hypothetical protein